MDSFICHHVLVLPSLGIKWADSKRGERPRTSTVGGGWNCWRYLVSVEHPDTRSEHCNARVMSQRQDQAEALVSEGQTIEKRTPTAEKWESSGLPQLEALLMPELECAGAFIALPGRSWMLMAEFQ